MANKKHPILNEEEIKSLHFELRPEIEAAIATALHLEIDKAHREYDDVENQLAAVIQSIEQYVECLFIPTLLRERAFPRPKEARQSLEKLMSALKDTCMSLDGYPAYGDLLMIVTQMLERPGLDLDRKRPLGIGL